MVYKIYILIAAWRTFEDGTSKSEIPIMWVSYYKLAIRNINHVLGNWGLKNWSKEGSMKPVSRDRGPQLTLAIFIRDFLLSYLNAFYIIISRLLLKTWRG